jgi:uncharacterized protein YcnI
MRLARLSATGFAGGVILALAAVPVSASAHIGLTPTSTAAGSSSVLAFSFNHGCDGSSTTSLTFQIPESITTVYPAIDSDWTVEKIADGDRTAQVVYTAVTPVPDGYRAAVELAVQLPEDAAGETLAFPVLQACEVGENDWNEIAEEGDEEPENAAPVMLVTEATGTDDHDAATGSGSSDSHGGNEEATAESSAADSSDTVARVLGIGGLVVGTIGIVVALATRRSLKGS